MSMVPPPRVEFSGMVGPKRRRLKSGGNVSTLTNNASKEAMPSTNAHLSSGIDDEATVQTSKCKGSNTIPIFLKSELSGLINRYFVVPHQFYYFNSLFLFGFTQLTHIAFHASFSDLINLHFLAETYKMIESSPHEIAAWYVTFSILATRYHKKSTSTRRKTEKTHHTALRIPYA